MDESEKKPPASAKPVPNEDWLERLGHRSGETPAGVTTYVGLLRQSPEDQNVYQLYQTLDMASSLQIQKADVAHMEELPAGQSPFGSLGGTRVFVRHGAKIKSVKTATSTFEAGATDEFDLDVKLGARSPASNEGSLVCTPTIPETGCGAECDKTAPFTDPDVGCKTTPQTFCGCTANCTAVTACAACPPTGQPTCQCSAAACVTRTNCAQTCVLTRCATCNSCQTCNTNCGTCVTCQTCATNCGTCNTQCGTCKTCGGQGCLQTVGCTHVATRCPGKCQIP
jgi:hypothetical protein